MLLRKLNSHSISSIDLKVSNFLFASSCHQSGAKAEEIDDNHYTSQIHGLAERFSRNKEINSVIIRREDIKVYPEPKAKKQRRIHMRRYSHDLPLRKNCFKLFFTNSLHYVG